MNKKEAIDALIANGGYEESDRKTLEGFSEAKVVSMAGKLAKPTENKDDKKATENKEIQIPEGMSLVPKGVVEEMTGFIANAKRKEAAEKNDLVEQIVANDGNAFAKEDLAKMDSGTLTGIAKMLGIGQPQPVANYFGAQGGGSTGAKPTMNAEEKEEAYLPPTMNFGEKETAGAGK